MMKRLVVYGDIHGCYDEFVLLRKKVNLKNDDTEICVGDIITKGKNSIKTLKYIRKNNIQSVLGNHEDKIIRYLKHQKSSKKNPITLDLDEKNIVNNLSLDDVNYLKNMPLFVKFDNITILHGGLSNKDNLDKLSKNAKSKILRTRYLDNNLNFISYGKENDRSVFWADVYNGKQGFVVYGHQKFNEVKFNKHALGIDTGCVDAGKLSVAIFIREADKLVFQKKYQQTSLNVNKIII